MSWNHHRSTVTRSEDLALVPVGQPWRRRKEQAFARVPQVSIAHHARDRMRDSS